VLFTGAAAPTTEIARIAAAMRRRTDFFMFQTFPINEIYKREPITAVTGELLLWCGEKYRNTVVHVQ
jgi:hypothetical protein